MKNINTRAKLLVCFGIVTLYLVIVSVLSIYEIRTLVGVSDALLVNYMKGIEEVSEIAANVMKQQSLIRGIYISSDDEQIVESYTAELKTLDMEIVVQMDLFGSAFADLDNTAIDHFAEFKSAYVNQYRPYAELMEEFLRDGDMEAYAQHTRDGKAMFIELEGYIVSTVNAANSDASSFYAKESERATVFIAVITVISVISIVTSMLIGLYSAKSIATPLVKLSEQAKEVSIGNTNIEIESNRRDEIGTLAGTFSAMIDAIRSQSRFLDTVARGDYRAAIEVRSERDTMNKALNKLVENNNEMIAKIRLSSGQVSSASAQIAHAAQALASGSTEQAASVDEFTLTLNDVLEQTNKNAQRSAEALEVVTRAVHYIAESAELTMELLSAMSSIDESSRSITKVVKTIEDIAFQTNILALNAAVEAAHAGSHGRGFAVVAEEVRSLASGSSVAAKETAELIGKSALRVQEGSALVKKTNAYIQNISDSAIGIQSSISLIADSSKQQALSIAELHQGLEQISQVVQANSATSEQTAASAQEMSAQATMLDQTVAEFRLSDRYETRLGVSTYSDYLPSGQPAAYSPATEYYSHEEFSPPEDFGKY